METTITNNIVNTPKQIDEMSSLTTFRLSKTIMTFDVGDPLIVLFEIVGHWANLNIKDIVLIDLSRQLKYKDESAHEKLDVFVVRESRHPNGHMTQIVTSLLCQKSSRRRFDVILTLLLRRIPAGIVIGSLPHYIEVIVISANQPKSSRLLQRPWRQIGTKSSVTNMLTRQWL